MISAHFDDPEFRALLTNEVRTAMTCLGSDVVVKDSGVLFNTLRSVGEGDYRNVYNAEWWALMRWLFKRCEKWLRDCQIDGWLLDRKDGTIRTAEGNEWPNIYAFAVHHGYADRNRETRRAST